MRAAAQVHALTHGKLGGRDCHPHMHVDSCMSQCVSTTCVAWCASYVLRPAWQDLHLERIHLSFNKNLKAQPQQFGMQVSDQIWSDSLVVILGIPLPFSKNNRGLTTPAGKQDFRQIRGVGSKARFKILTNSLSQVHLRNLVVIFIVTHPPFSLVAVKQICFVSGAFHSGWR